jgi:outer membrane protein assembly factor BamB
LLIGAVGTVWYKVTDHGAPAVWTVSGSTTLHHAQVRGGWLTRDAVVRPQENGLIAYDRADGHQRWVFQLDDSTESVCGVSPEVSSGIGVVVFGVRAGIGENTCDEVAAIDADTGAVKWRATTADGWHRPDLNPSEFAPAVVGDVVAVMQPHGIAAYRRDDGTPLWTYDGSPECRQDALAGGGDRVISTLQCPGAASGVVGLDAGTGAEIWHGDLPSTEVFNPMGGVLYATGIVSADPPVVVFGEVGSSRNGEIRSFDRSGTLRAVIPTDDMEVAAGLSTDPASDAEVSGGLLIAVTKDHTDSPFSSPSVRIHAIDLGTGRTVWSVDPDPGSTYALIQAADGSIAVVEDDSGLFLPGHMRLLSLSSANGKSMVVGEYSPRVLHDLFEPLYLGDGFGVFGVAALEDNPADTSVDGTPEPGKPTQVAVVRIR